MNGLLSRLAARASGTTVAVRSDARLPLGGPVPVQSAIDVQAPSLTLETRPGVPSAPTFVETARSEALHDRLPSRVASAASALPGRIESDPQSDANAGRQPDRAVSDGAVVNLPATSPPRLVVDYSVDQAAVNLPPSQPAFEATDRSADSHVAEGGRSSRAVRVVREPPLLIPVGAADRTFAPPAAAGATARTPGGVAPPSGLPEERDVHIHIGCVEVTAVHEPPAPPRRRPVSTPPPMSLDAYLAKRARG